MLDRHRTDVILMALHHDRDESNATDSVQHRRRFGRLKQQGLSCNLGEILDVCGEGVRIRSWRKRSTNTLVTIRLTSYPLPGKLLGVVMWSKRIGFFKHDVGIQFHDADPETVRRLSSIAGCAGTRRITSEDMSRAA